MTSAPDFPFYNGRPIAVSGWGWLALMGSLALAFAALTLAPLKEFPLNLLPALLFVGLPLIALRLVAGSCWTALFRPVGVKALALMVAFAILTILGSLGFAFVLTRLFELSHNPVSELMRGMTSAKFLTVLIPTIPQLIGEELLGILPFLAILWLCVTHLNLSRRVCIVIALIVSGLIFGAAHLPTYNWNFAQSLIGIGAARVFLTLAYIATKNLWVSAGAHILNDWSGFIFVFALGHAPIGAEG